MRAAFRLAAADRRSYRDRGIAPFEEGPGGLPLLGVPLAERQDAAATGAGFALVSPGNAATEAALCFGPDAVFSEATLRALAEAADAEGRTVQAAVKTGTAQFDFAQPLVPGSDPETDLPLPIWAGPDLSEAGRAGAALVAICDEPGHHVIRTPPFGRPPHQLRVPRVEKIGARICHWVHLLNANLVWLFHQRRRQGAEGERNVRLGKAKVHRTAHVAGSILGDGVEIEAGASVIDCYLGRGVKIAPHAVMHTSVIGDRCHTLLDTHLRRCVAMEGSTLSNIGSEDLLLGREIFITTGVAFFGNRRGVDVVIDGDDSRRAVLGAAIGHGCILGARALFGEPVALPGRTVVVGRPDEAVQKLDDQGLARAGAHRGDRGRDA